MPEPEEFILLGNVPQVAVVLDNYLWSFNASYNNFAEASRLDRAMIKAMLEETLLTLEESANA